MSLLQARQAQALSRLRQAFTGGASSDVDVFTAAAMLAEGRSLAADALAVEFVPLGDFLNETGALLKDVAMQQAQVQQVGRHAVNSFAGMLDLLDFDSHEKVSSVTQQAQVQQAPCTCCCWLYGFAGMPALMALRRATKISAAKLASPRKRYVVL